MTDENNNSRDLGQYVRGLDNSLLRELAQTACECPVASVELSGVEEREGSIYGCFTGDKVVLRLSCETADGDTAETRIYVKRQLSDKGFKETGHYQYLNENGIPVPRFYGSHLDEHGLEVLFLEDATPNEDGKGMLKDPENYHAFLNIAARANALKPTGEYLDSLFYFGSDRHIVRARRQVRELWEAAADGKLGGPLKKLYTRERREELVVLADSLLRLVPAMHRGYTIDDFTPVKIGWRHGSGEMLVCDFRTTGLGARFGDAAQWIGCPDYAQKGGYKRMELADYYYRQFLDAGRKEVPFETLLDETHKLWQTGVLCGFGWWLASHFEGHHSMAEAEWQAVCREHLETSVTHLLKSVSAIS